MSGLLRSKQGCWTCRLRKKKCDERRPHCSTCDTLSITCYGFGPKPDWMNDDEKTKAVANSLKQIVKHTSRRKTIPRSLTKRGPTFRIAPKLSSDSAGNSSSSPSLSRQDGVTPPSSDHDSSPKDGVDMQQDASASSPSSEHGEHGEHSMAGSIFSISAEESILLMHFLDNVFPLQYPMYNPDVMGGGRGWLLALLFRTKPLYHAALALSSYHRRMVILERIRHPCRVIGLVQQEKHLEICLNELQQAMQSVCHFTQKTCPGNVLGFLTSVVQLVFFELFAGEGNIWHIHLRAATKMYLQGCEDNLVHLGLSEKSRTILSGDLPLSEDGANVTEEVTIFRFSGGTMVWLDIVSSITAGTAPTLLSYHSCIIGPKSQTKLEDIMGCKNWVMLQIGRIAAQYERKTQTLQHGHFECMEFAKTMDEISMDIQSGLTQAALEGVNISEGHSDTIFNTMIDPPTLITHIFAYMASVYLHLVVFGFQKLEALDTTISEAMRMLNTQIPINLLPALVSPLYVIGCVAKQGDQQFFRSIFSSQPLLDPLLQHRGKVLPILEEIWSRRQTTADLAWNDSLELTHDLLLI